MTNTIQAYVNASTTSKKITMPVLRKLAEDAGYIEIFKASIAVWKMYTSKPYRRGCLILTQGTITKVFFTNREAAIYLSGTIDSKKELGIPNQL